MLSKMLLAIVLLTGSCTATFAAGTRQLSPLPRRSVLGAAAVDAPGGIKITLIVPGGAADRAHLQVSDVVSAIGHRPIQSTTDFLATVKALPSGKPINFVVARSGVSMKLRVVVDAAPVEIDPLVDTRYQALWVDDHWQRVIVTAPVKSDRPVAAVLVLGGIGCYTVDNAADKQDAYARLAHDLGRRGIGAMRVEKSGVNDSQGPPCISVDLETEIHSYHLALTQLQHDPRIDARHIYLFGHSIGTLIAPRIARAQPVAGIVLAEGVGRNWIEYELANLRRQLELDGQPPDKVDERMHLKERCMHRLLIDGTEEVEIEKTEPGCKEMNSYPAPASYLRQAAAFNIAEPWSTLSSPLLAIYGTADFITTEADHQRIVDIVNKHSPGAATLQLIPGMDHHLDAAGTPQQAYDLRVKEHRTAPYESALSRAVLDWLCLKEQCRA